MPALFSRFSILSLICAAMSTSVSAQPPVTSDQNLRALKANLFDYVEDRQLSNLTYGLWKDGELIASNGAGLTQPGGASLASETTLYRIYSMTKPVTAVGLLILMERGHFNIDDPITNFLPEFEDTRVLADYDSDGEMYTYRPIRPPTMGHLLSHTAGFVYGIPGSGFLDDKLADLSPMASPTSDALVEKVASLPYNAMPGSEWRYSIASDLQGAIIERITGETLADFLEKEVFEPLGMDDTGFYIRASDLDRLSSVTRLSGPDLVFTEEPSARRLVQSANFYEGGQGLFSSQSDYLKFAAFLLNDGQLGDVRLLGEESVRALHTNAIRYRGEPARQGANGEVAGFGFGYGVSTIEDSKRSGLNAPEGTYFWYGAMGSWFWIDPENDVIFVGMTQSYSVPGYELLKVAMNSIYPAPESETVTTASASN